MHEFVLLKRKQKNQTTEIKLTDMRYNSARIKEKNLQTNLY